MCGIAGMFDLSGQREAPVGVVPTFTVFVVPALKAVSTTT